MPFVSGLCLALGSPAFGQEPSQRTPASFTAISPIFGELVMFSLPATFKTVYEKGTDQNYIREAVLEGETTERWSQMITVTGAKGVGSNRDVTPAGALDRIASGFSKACPTTFAAKAIGPAKIDGHDAFIAILSCGHVRQGVPPRSESAAMVAIRGTTDDYTLQWAERGAATPQPIPIDETVWKERLAKLAPMRLCPIVPGETAPYPSCVNRK